jgi:hypothetical protein
VVLIIRKNAGKREEAELQGVKALSILARVAENASKFYLAGACNIVADIIKRYSAKNLVIQWAFTAITALSVNCADAKEAFSHTSAPAAITPQLLAQSEASVNTYTAISDAVRALSDGNEDNRRTMCANGILDSLVRIAVRSRNSQFGKSIWKGSFAHFA